MIKKTSELTGIALDWAAARCDGRRIGFNLGGGLEVRGRTEEGEELPDQWDLWMPWHPSTDWSQGGPIIEREKIGVGPRPEGTIWPEAWLAASMEDDALFNGPTPLIAAMRCYVTSKLGDEVDVLDQLCTPTLHTNSGATT